MKETSKLSAIPRWYQDLSIAQMQKVFELGDIMRADYVERVTERTQRALGDIGVTSTFVKITPKQIRELRRLADLDPVKFLSEIYRIVAGKYFIDEEYKKVYDCNERIILSAIAFLTLPEIVMELNNRIPMGRTPKFPPKPVQQKIAPRRKGTSPYLEPLFNRDDELAYKQELYLWKRRCQAIPIPRSILPPWIKNPPNLERSTIADNNDMEGKESHESYREETTYKEKDNAARVTDSSESKSPNLQKDKNKHPTKIYEKDDSTVATNGKKTREKREKEAIDHRLDYSKTHFDKSSTPVKKQGNPMTVERHENISGNFSNNRQEYSRRLHHVDNPSSHAEKAENYTLITGVLDDKIPRDPQNYSKQPRFDRMLENGEKDTHLKIHNFSRNESPNNRSDSSKETHLDKKFWLGEKDTQLILSGVSENADYPISYETSGFAYVTPDNSDENFFAELNLGDDRKKKYPRGREYLSRNWQEWLQSADEEFMKLEKDANKIIKSIQDTVKLMLSPEISCDVCCSCRQTRKANVKYHKTKSPHAVIDSLAVDGKQNKYIVGSLSMASPAPSPSESTADLPEAIESHDKIVKNISGVTNEKGETKYYVSGVSKEIERVPRKMSNSKLPKRIKNVPPCGCAIEKMINEGLMIVTSDDNIPWTKKDNLCVGKKYRPRAISADREMPNDKLCRRNPFKKKVDEKIRATLRGKINEEDYCSVEKNMYSLAEFQPCGDEDGMAVCGGPWGALNVPDAEDLAKREAKLILESPPCGDKPGRAVCGAPFGTRHPIVKKPKKDDDDDDEEEDEEEELDPDELKEKKKREREERMKARKAVKQVAEKLLNRDELCFTVAEKIPGTDKPGDTALAHSTIKIDTIRSKKMARLDKRKRTSSEINENEYESNTDSRDKRESSENHGSTKSRNKTKGRSKKERELYEADEERDIRRSQTKYLKNHWNSMKKLANKLITSPIIFPEDQSRFCKREDDKRVCCRQSETSLPDEEPTNEGPFGWRTKSEEALLPEKTLVYLVKPQEPVETVPLRSGGKACECRENRNKKKVLLYNVTAVVTEGKGKRDTKHSRVIDGLIYITPTPSVRISEEYIPEYELYDSPYEMCLRDRKNDDYTEEYLAPKIDLKKNHRDSEPCECSSMKRNINPPNKILQQNLRESITKKPQVSAEKKLECAFEDEGLVNFYARCRDNVPCWLRCIEFSKDGCCVVPRGLQLKRPVCECKYERKILKREEEKTNWLRRKTRLKKMKKQACNQIAGLSRPMRTETNVMISNVTRIHREDEDIDDIEYCVSGISQDTVMGPAECIQLGIGMHTPVITPKISKAEIRISKPPHRHWSPLNIKNAAINKNRSNLSPINIETLIYTNAENEQLKDSEQVYWKSKLNDKANKRIDVLYQSGQGNTATNHHLEKKRQYVTEEDRKFEGSQKKLKASQGEKLESSPADIQQLSRPQTSRLVNETSPKKSVSPGIQQPLKSQKSRSIDEKTTKKSVPSAIQQPFQSNAARPVNKEITKKTIPSIQRSNKVQNADAVYAGSKKKSSAGESAKVEKSNLRARKSTGSIVSKRAKTDLEDNKVEAKINFGKLLQIELEKMADEGFLFAKLPACRQMPQLQYWIMYRNGVAFTSEEKKKLMDRSIKIWNAMEKAKPKKFEAPAIEMSKKALENLTFDEAEKIKKEVTSKKAAFYSQLRKLRVLQARAMWNLMEFGKFPGVSFKKAYFTYQAGKEADGFIFKPYEKE